MTESEVKQAVEILKDEIVSVKEHDYDVYEPGLVLAVASLMIKYDDFNLRLYCISCADVRSFFEVFPEIMWRDRSLFEFLKSMAESLYGKAHSENA